MELVRLYIRQDNRQWQETIPKDQLLNRIANLEIDGATVEHASKMTMVQKSKRKQRTTLAGAARHLYA
jgi:hypothetical protein